MPLALPGGWAMKRRPSGGRHGHRRFGQRPFDSGRSAV